MSSHKTRLAKLEAQHKPAAGDNPYMTMDMQQVYAAAWQAVQDGKPSTPQETNPETEALRADILRRLQKIAEAQHEQP